MIETIYSEICPERAPRGQGAHYKRDFLCSHPARHCVPGKPRPVGGELHSWLVENYL